MTQNSLHVEILIQEALDDRWQDWFPGLALSSQPGGSTCLSGSLPDQAALYGILLRLRDLNLTLESVQVIYQA